ncbi:unnamed protein product [Citrullus colocynthis]|uniref:Uncharacterized protein n=1 Tax=Citrullus colocynthis TaxID=252529 RepID=A0ABP0XRL9_9ROSI
MVAIHGVRCSSVEDSEPTATGDNSNLDELWLLQDRRPLGCGFGAEVERENREISCASHRKGQPRSMDGRRTKNLAVA